MLGHEFKIIKNEQNKPQYNLNVLMLEWNRKRIIENKNIFLCRRCCRCHLNTSWTMFTYTKSMQYAQWLCWLRYVMNDNELRKKKKKKPAPRRSWKTKRTKKKNTEIPTCSSYVQLPIHMQTYVSRCLSYSMYLSALHSCSISLSLIFISFSFRFHSVRICL